MSWNSCQRHSHPHLAPATTNNDRRKDRLRNDRCTPASHFRLYNMKSPARKWYQSTMTVCGSSADTVTQACETTMVPKPWELDTPLVGVSTLQWQVRNHLVQPQNLQALEATLLQEWDNIAMLSVFNLIYSMLRKCSAVLSANGGHTRYWRWWFFILTLALPIESDRL